MLFDKIKMHGAATDVLSAIGVDLSTEGLKDTPKRMVESWYYLFRGYQMDPVKILERAFTEGACNEMITLKDIDFYSTCEHHFLPFFGKVHIGYIPDGRVVGISKLARLVEVFARRLQIQERMTTQIADTFEHIIKPKGVIVLVQAQHFCMSARGVEKQNARMITSAIRGVFEDLDCRNEFMQAIK